MKVIDDKQLRELTSKAQVNERKRQNYNLHDGDHDLVQRMLNAFEPHTYVCPHKHINPDKREAFIILKGRLLVIFFNDEGEIVKHVILDKETGQFAVEIEPKEWHSATGLEEGTVVYEVKDGPYIQAEDKVFATWAPSEGSKDADKYLQNCLSQLDINIG